MGAGRRLWAVALVVMGAEASLSGTVCPGAAAADRSAAGPRPAETLCAERGGHCLAGDQGDSTDRVYLVDQMKR